MPFYLPTRMIMMTFFFSPSIYFFVSFFFFLFFFPARMCVCVSVCGCFGVVFFSRYFYVSLLSWRRDRHPSSR